MTKINYFREDLAKLLSKYDAELSIDDKGNIIQVYFWEGKKTYSVCKNVPDLKKESINYKDVRLSIEVDSKDYHLISGSSEIPNSSFFCNDEKHYPKIGRCKTECEMCRTERLKNATKP